MDISTTIFMSVVVISACVFSCVAFMGILNAFMKYTEWKCMAETSKNLVSAVVEAAETFKEYLDKI